MCIIKRILLAEMRHYRWRVTTMVAALHNLSLTDMG